jgi:hypothetical protein
MAASVGAQREFFAGGFMTDQAGIVAHLRSFGRLLGRCQRDHYHQEKEPEGDQ